MVCVWCDMLCRFFVAINMCLLILTVVTYCVLLLMFYCVWCDTIIGYVIWCAASVHWCCVSETVHTLDCCVLESGCGSAGVVSGLPAEAQLACSCGMWGLGLMTV